MKKIKLVTIVFALISLTGCGKFLDVQKEGELSTENLLTADENAIALINPLLDGLGSEAMFGQDFHWEQSCASTLVIVRAGDGGQYINQLASLNFDGDCPSLTTAFRRIYERIAGANFAVQQFLAKKESGETLSAIETRSLGEAYFLRAYWHLLAAYRYGCKEQGVPFCRYEDYADGYDYSIPPQLPSVLDNFKMIISDLEEAETYLPRMEEYAAGDLGRAHKASAKGLMAKVYAYMATWDKSQWENVITTVNELESKYNRDLTPTFAELFTAEPAEYWNNECLWSIPSTGGTKGNGCMFAGVVMKKVDGYGWREMKTSNDLYEEMLKDGEGNDRLAKSILVHGEEYTYNGGQRIMIDDASKDETTGFIIKKWMACFEPADFIANGYANPNTDYMTTNCNYHILRFADCLLLRAEAYLNTGRDAEAMKDINRVRTRSNLEPLTAVSFADLYHERRCELAFEGCDWAYDLKRWAVSGESSIKALAIKELEAYPTVRRYENDTDPESSWTIEEFRLYKTSFGPKKWEDYKIVFPYPSIQITESGGMLKQNPGYSS